MSKSKIPVRDLTPMFHQVAPKDEGHRSRRDKSEKTSFSANFGSDRSKSLERNQRSNEKVKDLRNLVSENSRFGKFFFFTLDH